LDGAKSFLDSWTVEVMMMTRKEEEEEAEAVKDK
jgi:hypothetical protein